MSIIRQESLFGMQDLYELEPTKRFDAIFSTLHIEPLLFAVSKKTVYGAPTELNYPTDLVTLVYNASKLAVDRIKRQITQMKQIA